jgi:hypothetical protein
VIIALALATLLGGLPSIARADAPTQPPPGGWSSADLYNLGNRYARAGKTGLAVLNYERARMLAPDDPDVEANLDLVRRSLALPVEPRSRLSRAVGGVNPTAAAWIGLGGWLLLSAALLAGALPAGPRWVHRAGVIAGIALTGFTVANALTFWPRVHEAIVIAASTPVRVSPAPMADALFTLKEADAVTIGGEHEGFWLVRTAGGRAGWVWQTDLAPVVPRR